MSVITTGIFNKQSRSPWIANQVVSSAEMVDKMVRADLHAGDLSEMESRIARIEEILEANVLEAELERKLILVAARLLDAGGQYKRVNRLVGQLMADEARLKEPFYSELRRFSARLALNRADFKNARYEVDHADRTATETPESLGKVKEELDEADVSGVTTATWLLSAEVAISEGNYQRAHQELINARDRMAAHPYSTDEGAMFELLSALVNVGLGDSAGAPALAYLYRMHVDLRAESPVEAQTSARIAAAAGDLHRVAGINEAEARRWRGYGPQPEAVEAYLRCETPPPLPSSVLAELPSGEDFDQIINDTFTEKRRVQSQEERKENAGQPLLFMFPLTFLLEHTRLDSVTGMFDVDLVTGPLLVDWAGCDPEDVRGAIEAGAISEIAARVSNGTIYFNNGAYVDATFGGDDLGILSASPVDVIFELYRIGMARLPKSGACLLRQGPEAAHEPELVNLRPNRYNPDILIRFDKLRHVAAGGTLPAMVDEEADFEKAFSGWTGFGTKPGDLFEQAEQQQGLEETAVSGTGAGHENEETVVSMSPAAQALNSDLFSPILEVIREKSVAGVCNAILGALSALGLSQARVEVSVHDLGGLVSDAGLKADECSIWAKYPAGPMTLSVYFQQDVVILCPEAVDVVLNAAAQRLRTMPGAIRVGKAELSGFIAHDPVTQGMLSQLRDFAELDGSSAKQKLKHILIVGERGTGKEFLARAVHNWSRRQDKNFRAINLGAIAKELAPSEIFGSKKGAFTGASNDRRGYLQESEGGTLFLDEIDEADENTQALLKRVVQFGTYNTVGSPEELQCDVRFVAATNRVSSEIPFIKEDLRDRFWEIRVPPLRDRRGDIRPLAEYFASQYEFTLPDTVLEYLERLDWPGNVRQLQNAVERACALANSPDDLSLEVFEKCVYESGGSYTQFGSSDSTLEALKPGETLEDWQGRLTRKLIVDVLSGVGGNRKHAADALGITRQWLGKLMTKLDIPDVTA